MGGKPMKTSWIVILAGALALLGLAAPAAARSAAPRITISETPSGVSIVYDLAAPTTSLALRAAEQEGPPQGTHIGVAESGLSYRRGQVSATRPFRRVTLLIAPDDGEVDSVYPLLTPVAGRGFVLFAPYVLPDAPFTARVSIGGGRDRPLSRAEAAGGYVVVGAAPAARGRFRALSSAAMPAGLQATLYGRAGALLRFYGARLHRPPAGTPTLILTYDERPAGQAQALFRGDVTANGVAFLRFHGTPTQLADPASTSRTTSFLAHELFHLWNRRRGEHPMTEAWLHEGAAEYEAWIATDALWPGEIRLAQRLEGALGNCAAFLADRALATLPPDVAMQVRYSCGPIVQWLADAGVRGASGGRRNGLDLWAGLLARGRGDYSVAGFEAAARAEAPATAEILVAMIESGARWDALAPALAAAGAMVEARPPTRGSILFAATRAVVGAMCTAFWGAGTDEAGVYFNSPPCDLPGTFTHLARIDGIDPMADADAYFAHVREACARGAELGLILRGEGGEVRRTARCTVPPARAPLDFHITRPLPFSPPARS
jgi:hypothetical protein